MSQNGKGDAPRPTNYKRFSQNWDKIDWRGNQTLDFFGYKWQIVKCKSGYYVGICDKLQITIQGKNLAELKECIREALGLDEKLNCPLCDKNYSNCGRQDKYIGLDIPTSFIESIEALQNQELEDMFDDKGNLNH